MFTFSRPNQSHSISLSAVGSLWVEAHSPVIFLPTIAAAFNDLSAVHLAFIREKIRSTECIVSWDRKRCRNNAKYMYVSRFLKIRRKSDWRPTAAVIPEFNMNRRIRNKSYGEAKIRDILRPGKTQAGTRDTEAEIRDVPGNTGLLASLLQLLYQWRIIAESTWYQRM